jgi:hypothetical protein
VWLDWCLWLVSGFQTRARATNGRCHRCLWANGKQSAGTEAYTQALLELELEALERKLLGDAVEQKFTALEMEQELQALKAQIPTPGRDVTDHAFTTIRKANLLIQNDGDSF